MIRPAEQLIFFPALARPLGAGRWEATLRALLNVPHLASLKRRLLVRAIARGADVRHDSIVLPLLYQRLAPFLADSRRGRRIAVEVAGEPALMGPSGANGHMTARVVFDSPALGVGAVECAVAPNETDGRGAVKARRFAGVVHLLPARGLSVISDIDDTIKHSNVPDTRDLLRNTFLRPFRAVGPVGELHAQLRAAGAAFHYVSASPWQLYPALEGFLGDAGLPPGTFHLKAFRLRDSSALSLLASPRPFKLALITTLLTAWPRRKFVLVGDSAELDPEIYGELARRFPRQVSGVIVRDITGEKRECPRYQRAFEGMAKDRWEVLPDDADWNAAAQRAISRSVRAG